MFKFIFFLASSLLLPLAASAQFTISGRVISSDDGRTLPGAHVIIAGSYQGVFSDADGFFALKDLEPGNYIIRVSFMGFEEGVQEIDLQDNTDLDFFMERKTTMTQEVVVSALRAGGQTPATYTNINAEELAPKNLGRDLPALLGQTPSLIFSSDAGTGVGYTWINIRGSDQSRINVTINGIPVNDAESHGVWWVNMPDFVSSVENLQIQRGVGLSTHGAGAFGATISLQSIGLREKTYAEISSAAGAFNTFKNTVSFGTGLTNNKWSFDGRLSKLSSDGYIDRASADLKSFYLAGGYFGENTMLKAVLFSGQESTYQAWYGVPSDSLKTNRTFNPAGMYIDADGTVQFYDNETDNYQQDHYQLHFSHNLSPQLFVNTALHYTRGRGYYEQYRQNDRFGRYNLPNVVVGDTVLKRTDLVRQRWLDNHFYGFTYSLNYNNYRGLELVLGGAYNEYDGDHFGEIIWARNALNTNIRHRYYDNNALKKDFNSFVKASYELSPGLNVFADMQYRYVSYSFQGRAMVLDEVVPLQQKALFHFFNPKAGISYDINHLNNIFLYAGIGNREPVRRDFTESSPESRPKHETLRNIELGYNYQSRKTRLGANFYLMDYKNQLVLTGEINDVGGFSRVNIDDSYRMGIELEAGYIFNRFMTWNGNITLSRNKIKLFEEHTEVYDADENWTDQIDISTYEDTDIAFSPPVIGASTFIVSPFKGLNISLDSKYVGKQYIDNTMSNNRMLDAYIVNDLRINYSITPAFMREIEFVIQVNNIFDAKYETNAWIYKAFVEGKGITTLDDGYFPQAGRHLMFGLNLRF